MSKSWISRSRSYGLAYGRQPFKGRTHGHRVEQKSGGRGGARRLRGQESLLSEGALTKSFLAQRQEGLARR